MTTKKKDKIIRAALVQAELRAKDIATCLNGALRTNPTDAVLFVQNAQSWAQTSAVALETTISRLKGE